MSTDVATQRRGLPLHVTPENCSGGTFIVIGANTGLGLEAARHLVAVGASKVIMGVRNLDAGETAKTNIESSTGKTGIAEVWKIDLSSYDSVKAFAKKAIAELERVDALIENAAVAMSQRVLAEGHSLPITVNVFGTFLLAVLMFPKLRDDAKKFGILPHISIVSSSAGFDYEEQWNLIKEDPLVKSDDESMVTLMLYPLSKLMEILAVKHIAPQIPASRTGVVLNVVCPGLCITELSRNAPPAFKEQIAVQHKQYGRTAEDGSRTLLHGAVAGKETHGRLLASCEIATRQLPSWLENEEGKQAQKRVWDDIAKELESVEPGCVSKMLQA